MASQEPANKEAVHNGASGVGSHTGGSSLATTESMTDIVEDSHAPEANTIDLGRESPVDQSPATLSPPPTIDTPQKPIVSTAQTPESVPIKSRSNSTLQSSRPAPPSPAASRPSSQILSPHLAPTGFPSPSRDPSREPPRDRSLSTSSSSRGRRVSSSSHPSTRTSSKARPRSALGAASFLPQEGDGSGHTTPTNVAQADPSLATLPEDVPAQPTKKREEDRIVIRDFAFAPSDPRFRGPGLPLALDDDERSESRRSSRWAMESSPDMSNGSSSRKNSSWSGFGLLSWRGLMGRRRGSTDADADSRASDEEDYSLPGPDHLEDDYAFSESEPASEEGEEEGEPWGFYRAAYAFEAIGEHELGLEEDDLVEVRGRGGGEGWVVAVKRRTDEQGRVIPLDDVSESEGWEGLVPESYLERAEELKMAPSRENRNTWASHPDSMKEEDERVETVHAGEVDGGGEGHS